MTGPGKGQGRRGVMALGSLLGRNVIRRIHQHYEQGFGWRYDGLGDWRTEDIFAKLRELGIETDADSFRSQAAEAGGPEALTDLWLQRHKAEGLWEDFLLFAPEELWKRLLPDVPCPELLFAEIRKLMDAETEIKHPVTTAELRKHLDAAQRLEAMARQERPADPGGWLEEWQDKHDWSASEWVMELPFKLAGAGLVDEAVALCRAWAPLAMEELFLGDLCVILAQAGRRDEAEVQVRENIRRFPRHLWIRVHAGDACDAMNDLAGALDFFRQAEALCAQRDEHVAVLDRQIEILNRLGHEAEAAQLRQRAEVLRHRTGSRNPARNPRQDEDAAARAEEDRSKAQLKIGRNEPCSCGSGKKYKKCCGR